MPPLSNTQDQELLPEPQMIAPEVAAEVRVIEQGGASWYGPRFHGRRTASGERYDMHALTAAHRTLPFGTLVRVRSLVNGREVDVRINDRGPFSRLRVIDLSRAAAVELDMLGLGIKNVLLLSTQDAARLVPLTPLERAPLTTVPLTAKEALIDGMSGPDSDASVMRSAAE